MSYLVLARKYRPQTFSDVIGQEHVTRTLENAIRRGRVHHAFLFCGARGTGKTTTARILAKALSCVNAPTATPCNECPACVEITQGTSVDVQEIDAASQNRVEDIRELREAIRYAPVRGKKKLYILDEVHMLSTSAFNALLKTLEEPPPHALFVFATTDPHKLPQTILSRVQRYDFKLVPTARLLEHLASVLQKEGISFEQSALQLIAREGQGSVRDSMSLLDQVLASTEGTLTEELASSVLGVADRGLVVGLGRAVVERNAARGLELVQSAYSRGFDLTQLAKSLLAHFRDLLVVSVVPDPMPLLEVIPSELSELETQSGLAKGKSELLFHRMLRVADETSRAALPRYVLEVGVVDLCCIEPMQPIGELVDRLEGLETRLGGTPGARPRAMKNGGDETRPFVRRVEQSAPAWSPPPVVAATVAVQALPKVAEHRALSALPTHVETAPVGVFNPAPESVNAAEPVSASALPEFHNLLEQIISENPTLSALSGARKLRWDMDVIRLGFPSQFALDVLEKKRSEVEQIFRSRLGGSVSVELSLDAQPRPIDPAAWSLDEMQTQVKTDDRLTRQREAETHPARQLLSEAFGAVSFLSPIFLEEVS
ncbi:MAG TPA: DNA polymerase III subunit gamma/tau [Pseudomonadota bacterium]|nr:DNA polymerase III subunit gamma/tau [Pseudomonadota bacterium]